MPTREQYVHQLEALDTELQELGRQVGTAMSRALYALKHRDTTTANWVIDDDEQINRGRDTLDERVMVVIATQQPVASDLRQLLATIDIADELERIGDYAKGIAQVIIRGAEQLPVPLPATLSAMAEQASSMLHEALEAVRLRDVGAAQRLSEQDNQIDLLYRQAQAELLRLIQSTPEASEQAVDLLRVAHNLERTGDRTTNIGERIIFMVSGETVNLNP